MFIKPCYKNFPAFIHGCIDMHMTFMFILILTLISIRYIDIDYMYVCRVSIIKCFRENRFLLRLGCGIFYISR